MAFVSVAFVDDHPLLLEGVSALFARDGRFEVVGDAASAEGALTIFSDSRPDLMFLDLSMPGDIFAAMKEITTRSTETKVLVYTAYTSVDLALKALDHGASAFIVKDSVSNDLFCAVEAVLRGELFISQAYAGRILGGLRDRTIRASSARAANLSFTVRSNRLSMREKEVVKLLLRARSNKEIALDLSISEKTVKHHMTNLMVKLNARNRTEVALAAQHELDAVENAL